MNLEVSLVIVQRVRASRSLFCKVYLFLAALLVELNVSTLANSSTPQGPGIKIFINNRARRDFYALITFFMSSPCAALRPTSVSSGVQLPRGVSGAVKDDLFVVEGQRRSGGG